MDKSHFIVSLLKFYCNFWIKQHKGLIRLDMMSEPFIKISVAFLEQELKN